MLCPKCNIEMSQTYEPYEERCSKCGYWFDHWTGKEVDLSPKPHDYELEDDSGNDDQFVHEHYDPITGEYSDEYIPPEWIS